MTLTLNDSDFSGRGGLGSLHFHCNVCAASAERAKIKSKNKKVHISKKCKHSEQQNTSVSNQYIVNCH